MNRAALRFGFAALVCAALSQAYAAREPVLKQVDLPHSYYWRELYLPQLTTGPSSVDFMPDGQSVVYSMGGSLWRQQIGTTESTELTHAQGAYDYQPDVASDGRTVVFSRYDGKSIELWRLDLADGGEQALTRNAGVNIEPRLSPDGSRIAWVSTAGTGHFNLMLADVDAGGIGNSRTLLEPRQSKVDRYYYSSFDHAINPSWSPDGERVFFVSNREVPWGTGDVYSISVRNPADLKRILSEETSWSARPEVSPDGHRLLYASYHGRQSYQLWLSTPKGAAPLPLTFGEFDRRNARWSADGERIAYISNANGNTSLVIQEAAGGAETTVSAEKRRYRLPQASLTVDIRDAAGARLPARVSVLGSDARAYAPETALMHSDDGFDRALQRIETQYFHCAPPCTVSVPAGATAIKVQHGFRHLPWQQTISLSVNGRQTVEAKLQSNDLPSAPGNWVSADLHMHMNYGGHYRNTPQHLVLQASAEDLDIVHNLVVNKEERIPDIAYFSAKPDPASNERVLLLHSQEFHSSFWGHLGLLHLSDHFLTPDFTSYRHTALASPYPHNGVIADLAHAQNGLVGYAHPFDTAPVPAREKSLTMLLPADVINGKADYLEVVGFSDHKATAAVWYRMLNLGFRVPAGAGSDTMANYASLRGPVGLTRTFLETGGARTPQAAREALKQGRTFATNGPLLSLELAGMRPGAVLAAGVPGKVPYRIALRSPVAIDHLELVHNGNVVESLRLKGDRRSLDAAGTVQLNRGGWVLLRAWNERADPVVLDIYPYATTSPIYIESPDRPPAAAQDAAYFVEWLDRTLADVQAREDFNNDRERNATLDYVTDARNRYVELERSAKEKAK